MHLFQLSICQLVFMDPAVEPSVIHFIVIRTHFVISHSSSDQQCCCFGLQLHLPIRIFFYLRIYYSNQNSKQSKLKAAIKTQSTQTESIWKDLKLMLKPSIFRVSHRWWETVSHTGILSLKPNLISF